jgi:hypothetical protein
MAEPPAGNVPGLQSLLLLPAAGAALLLVLGSQGSSSPSLSSTTCIQSSISGRAASLLKWDGNM